MERDAVARGVNMKNKRILFFYFSISGLFLYLLIPKYALAQALEFTFSTTSCADQELGDKNYIEDAHWDNNKLIISTISSTNCAWTLKGKAEQDGDTLSLSTYGENDKGRYAECVCASQGSFAINGIAKKDYHIVLNKKDSLLLRADNSVSDSCDQTPDYPCYFHSTALSNDAAALITEQARIAFEHGQKANASPELLGQINNRLKLDVQWIAVPNASSTIPAMEFLYNGEKVYFGSNHINFLDRPRHEWSFFFWQGLPDLSKITREEVLEHLMLADSAYKLIEKIEGLQGVSAGFIQIDRTAKVANFSAEMSPDVKDKKIILIHSRQINDTRSVEKKIRLDLAAGFPPSRE